MRNAYSQSPRGKNEYYKWELSQIRDYIRKLEDERKKKEKEGDYTAASEINNQYASLKDAETIKIWNEITKRHDMKVNKDSSRK